MRKQITLIFLSIVWIQGYASLRAQSLPVGFPLIEEGLRRGQLLGTVDSLLSFNIRSLNHIEALQQKELSFTLGSVIKKSANEQFNLQILPISTQIEYTSNTPYQTNNGLMLPLAGFQSILSAGFYAKLGILTLQLYPTLYHGLNRDFDGFPESFNDNIWRTRYSWWNRMDLPERYGSGTINQLDWGQSQLALSYKAFTLALSNQNIWWGPGKNNALILSNNAAGFKHFTFKSNRPVNIFIGHLEWELIGGILENSMYSPPFPTARYSFNPFFNTSKNSDARYMNGISISYHPKWVPGLFLGINRIVQNYSQIAVDNNEYLPVFANLMRNGGDDNGSDGQISASIRYVLKEAQAEFYFDFGKNDATTNARVLLVMPQDSRAYLFGATKIMDLPSKNKLIELNFEVTKISQTINRVVRNAGSWYVHGKVLHGFTQLGEVLGASVGPGGDQQDFNIKVVDSQTSFKYGLNIRRVVHNNDFLYRAFGDLDERKPQWTDLSMGLEAGGFYKRFIFEGQLTYIYSLNYQWELFNESKAPLTQGNNQSNVFLGIKTAYQF
ncbi:capsule assembly Wzi family protein [Cyclobacteriaceae bacterium]|nr:capsule assembly Wzi family protein [Cyclobacteriaceae bacterium]